MHSENRNATFFFAASVSGRSSIVHKRCGGLKPSLQRLECAEILALAATTKVLAGETVACGLGWHSSIFINFFSGGCRRRTPRGESSRRVASERSRVRRVSRCLQVDTGPSAFAVGMLRDIKKKQARRSHAVWDGTRATQPTVTPIANRTHTGNASPLCFSFQSLSLFFSISRRMPTANAEDPCPPEGT